MQTPDTPRGRETERLMTLWRRQNPDADSSAYNREWEAVYVKLKGEFSDKEDRTMLASGDINALFSEDRDRRVMIPFRASSDDTPSKDRSYESERAAKRRLATKGAFGKPKHLRRR